MDAEVRLYDRLFTVPEPVPTATSSNISIGTHSEVVTAKCEPALKEASAVHRYQFERLAYFALDKDSAPGRLVFNRTITLKDIWAKEVQKS
jgi:glutaminyl-tRNA synthetase